MLFSPLPVHVQAKQASPACGKTQQDERQDRYNGRAELELKPLVIGH
jgi:hypothetical protein